MTTATKDKRIELLKQAIYFRTHVIDRELRENYTAQIAELNPTMDELARVVMLLDEETKGKLDITELVQTILPRQRMVYIPSSPVDDEEVELIPPGQVSGKIVRRTEEEIAHKEAVIGRAAAETVAEFFFRGVGKLFLGSARLIAYVFLGNRR